MAFRAKILPWRTLRFNECVCLPFNADFDGDEMNIHLPQTEEAKAESLILMGVRENLITPKSAEPIVTATQDFLTTFFIITQKDYFMDRAHFFKYLNYMNDGLEKIEIPPPCILKPVELWSGKQLFSLLLRPNRKSRTVVNLEVKARNYSKKGEFKCLNDGYIVIKNSELLTGNIDKVTIGSGSKSGIVFVLIKDNNTKITTEFLSRIAKFSSRWIGDYGISFGISDVYPREDLIKNKEELIKSSYAKCDLQIKSFENGEIELKAGMNAEQSLESQLNKTLSDVRDTLGSQLRSILPKSNSALIMAVCGSKGSDINLSQMIACLGQQIVSGHRIPNGFFNRTTPHFEPNSKYPAAKGFVQNSFYTGLNATEFFFHTAGGREGLVDTAVKTAETGYMQRRLMKALEDLTVQYDYSVTISSGEVLQFIYGDDAIDPMNVDDGGKVVLLNRLYQTIRNSFPNFRIASNEFLKKEQVMKIVEDEISTCPVKGINEEFLKEVRTFFKELTQKMTTYLENSDVNINNSPYSITQLQLREFFKICWTKYRRAMIVPGEAVGAVAAMSIGEPGTQMTLKTFHFAGVASMNITLGVPRIKEIINGTTNIATPVIIAKLVQENDLIAARIVKGRVEKTKLSDIVEYVKEVMSNKGCYLKLKLDLNTINALKLEIKLDQIKEAIINPKLKLKLKEKHVVLNYPDKIKIEPYDTSRENMFFILQILKKKIGDVIVSGIPTISRAVINKKEEKNQAGITYNLAIEGKGLGDIMRVPGIDHRHCTSNDILEVEKILGIEAARSTIIKEIQFTMGGHGIQVDIRHLQLVSDLMTFKGKVLGFQRSGMSQMKDSVLLHSSFEKTTDHLFEASFHSRTDKIMGVSECIIMGKMIKLGTGIFKTIFDSEKFNSIQSMTKLNEKKNIIEERIKKMNIKKESEIANAFCFNLIDSIK
jgi:DNA-directed RNA polymerase III subunit RPC1